MLDSVLRSVGSTPTLFSSSSLLTNVKKHRLSCRGFPKIDELLGTSILPDGTVPTLLAWSTSSFGVGLKGNVGGGVCQPGDDSSDDENVDEDSMSILKKFVALLFAFLKRTFTFGAKRNLHWTFVFCLVDALRVLHLVGYRFRFNKHAVFGFVKCERLV